MSTPVPPVAAGASRERGFALVVAMLVLLVMTLLGVVLMASVILNRSLAGFYNTLLRRRPQWMRLYFRLIDSIRPNERDFFYFKVRRYIGRFIDEERPDIVLSVHPMMNHFLQRFIKEEQMGIPCYTFLTDPFPPFWRGWSSPYVDRYFVATDEALQALTASGDDASVLTVARSAASSAMIFADLGDPTTAAPRRCCTTSTSCRRAAA